MIRYDGLPLACRDVVARHTRGRLWYRAESKGWQACSFVSG